MSTVGIDSILAGQTSFSGSSAAEKSKSLGKDDFLNLLVKQLQYQDPLNPVENADFTAHLALFTSLETLTNIDENIASLGILQSSINNMNALSFIGKQVEAQGNIVNYSGGEVRINYELDSPAATVEVNIYDSRGKLVRPMESSNATAGVAQCTWDGLDDNGYELGEGRYRFSVRAVDYEGAPVGATTYTSGLVEGVRYEGGITYLIIGDKEINIADIKKIQG